MHTVEAFLYVTTWGGYGSPVHRRGGQQAAAEPEGRREATGWGHGKRPKKEFAAPECVPNSNWGSKAFERLVKV